RALWFAVDYCEPRNTDLDVGTRDLSHCPLPSRVAHREWLLANPDAPPTGDFFPVPPLYIVQNEWDEIHKERPFAIDSYVPRTRAAGAALGGALWAETPPELHVVRHDMVYIDPVREKEAWLSALRETVWQWHRYPYPALFEHYRNFTVAVRGPQFGAQDVIRPNSKRPDKLNGWLQAEAARLQAEPFDSLSPELKERLFFVQLFQAELSSSSWWSGNWWRHLRRTLAMPVNGQHEITLATFDAAMLWRRQLAKHRTAILAARTAQRPVRLWTYDHAQLSSPGIERYAQVARCGHQTFIQRQLMYNTEGFVLDFAQLLATSPDAASLSSMTTLAVESDVEGDNATESVGESGGYGDDEANGAYGGDAASGMGGLHGWESAAHPALADYFLLPNRFSCFLFFTRYQRDTPEANMSDLYAELTDGYLRPLLVQAAYSLPYFRRSAGSDHLSLWQHGKNMGALPADLHRLMEPTRQLCFTGLHAEPNTGTYTAAMSKYEHRGVLPTYRSGWDVLLPPFTASQDVAFDTADAEPPAFANRSTALFFAGELSHFIDGDDSARPRLAKLSASIDSDAAVQWSGQRLRALRVLNGHTPDYAQYVATSVLLLCPEGLSPWSPRIYDGVFLGAVPLLMADGMELPFERVLHTNEFVARLPVQDIGELMHIKKRFEVTAEARSAARAAYRWPHSMQLLDAAERQQYLADELSTHPTSLYSALAQEMRCRRLEQLHGWLSPHVSTEQAQQARYEVCRKFGDVCPCPADWLHPAADGEGVRSLPGDAAAEEAAAIPAEVVVNNASAFVLPPMWAPAEVCESSPDLPDGWSVVHVWCLTRHGHRAPVNRLPGESDASFQALFPACTTAAIYGDDAPAEHSNGTLSPNAHSKACDRMELTALGEQQEFDVGRAVRQMLLDTPDGPVRRLLLGGGTGNGSEVTFQATDTSRTKLSLLRLAQGLFPDMLPTDFKRRLTVVGRESNYLVTPYHGSAWKCERVKQLWGEAWKGERWQQKLEAVGAAKLRNDIQAELQAAFNPKGGKPSLPGDWLTLADLFKPRLAIGAGIPANLQPRMVQAADELAAMQLWIESGGERLSSGELVTEEAEVARTHELRQLNTGQMLFDVMQRIEQHVNYSTAATSPPEEERPPLLSLQCAHDFTIGALLASLQLPDSRPEHYPAYASQVCVELVARGDRPLDVDDFLVRVRYQQRVQQCQSLRSFQQRMKSLAWPTTEREQRCAAH
ncbi:hypothetical protein MMC34_008586, partial [Xylographa carneopallida]|nr:hypothetical protein [Xylographa carneopallida]